MLAQERTLLPDVKAAVEAPTEEEIAPFFVNDDEAILTLVLGSTDVALPIVNVLADETVDTADVTLVVHFPEGADVMEAVDDVPVDVLAVVLGPLNALVSDTAELDGGDMLALDCVLLRGVEVGVATITEEQLALLLMDDDEAMLTLVLGPTDVALPHTRRAACAQR